MEDVERSPPFVAMSKDCLVFCVLSSHGYACMRLGKQYVGSRPGRINLGGVREEVRGDMETAPASVRLSRTRVIRVMKVIVCA